MLFVYYILTENILTNTIYLLKETGLGVLSVTEGIPLGLEKHLLFRKENTSWFSTLQLSSKKVPAFISYLRFEQVGIGIESLFQACVIWVFWEFWDEC